MADNLERVNSIEAVVDLHCFQAGQISGTRIRKDTTSHTF